jgi:hypothetical protein
MIERLMQYPRTWAEFLEWTIQKFGTNEITKLFSIPAIDINDKYVTEIIEIGLLIEWLDSKEIFVLVDMNIYEDDEAFDFYYKINFIGVYHYEEAITFSNNTRQSATESAIIKAFELLEGENNG